MQQTSDKLEFQEMLKFWIMLLVGGCFLVIGLLGIFGHSGSFFSYLFIVTGLPLVIFVEIDTFTFDKNLGHLTIKGHKPLLAKTKVIKYLIQDISGVEIQQQTGDYGRNLYRVCLVLESGNLRVPVGSAWSRGLKKYNQKAEVIATFLDIRNYGLDGFPR